MAASLRQFLNNRGLTKEESLSTSPEDDQRKVDPKMQAFNISPPVPQKSQSQSLASRFDPQAPRPLHSKFNDVDPQGWQHPLMRRNPSPTEDNDYNRSSSFDHDSQYRPQALMRSHTETKLDRNRGESGFDMDQTSLYEENESPALSPALHNHLALRPIDTQDRSYDPSTNRPRSRSVAGDNGYYGGADAWDGYGKDVKNHTRKDSLLGTSKPLPDAKGSHTVQLLKDRQRPPARQESIGSGNHKAAPSHALNQQAYQGRLDTNSPNHGRPTKVAHNPSGSDGSPTDSIGSDGVNGSMRGRKRGLDYEMHDLATKKYQELKNESFDHIPAASLNFSKQDLPNPSLPLPERLHQLYNDKNHKDKMARSRGFFASLTIDQYEECGDLLLDSFKSVMDKLKEARQRKRKAAQAVEDQIARREEWVRRKRGIIEQDLGRLKNSGTAVVKPIKSR